MYSDPPRMIKSPVFVGRCRALGKSFIILSFSLIVLSQPIRAQNAKQPEQTTSPISVITKTKPGENLIFVLPVEGTSRRVGLILADAIAASLRDIGAPAVLGDVVNREGPTVKGIARKVRIRDKIVWIELTWQLLAPYGTAVVTYRHELVLDKAKWNQGSIEAINVLIGEAAPEVGKMVKDFVGPRLIAVLGNGQNNEIIAARAKPKPNVKERVRPTVNLTPITVPQSGLPVEKIPVIPQAMIIPVKKLKQVMPPPKRQPIPIVKVNPVPSFAQMPVMKTPGNKTKRIRPQTAAGPPKRLMPGAGPQAIEKPNLASAGQPSNSTQIQKNEKPIIWGRPSFLIKPVLGAPGNGNRELTAAIKQALRARDLTISEDPRQAGYVVAGKVVVSEPVNGRQQTSIIWTVKTLAGQEVGRAVQENAVRAGSLDGRWGRVAGIVAKAAADGIEGLFDPEGRPLNSGEKPPPFNAQTNLPQIPGRAPPPPGN